MDAYVEEFQSLGGSLVMLAKGNRTSDFAASCQRNGGFYLGSVGGPAARLAQDCIRSVDVIDFPELGMEAVFRIKVENFPAFVVIDDKGNDFFAKDDKTLLRIGTDTNGVGATPVQAGPGYRIDISRVSP
jgi:fumarate hydratase class I